MTENAIENINKEEPLIESESAWSGAARESWLANLSKSRLLCSDGESRPSHLQLLALVSADYLSGMHQEAEEHPWKLSAEAVLGASISLTVSTLPRPYFIGAAYLGAALAITELGRGIMQMSEQSTILANPGRFPDAVVWQAHRCIHAMGASSINNLAVAAGGIAAIEGARLATGLRGSFLQLGSRAAKMGGITAGLWIGAGEADSAF